MKQNNLDAHWAAVKAGTAKAECRLGMRHHGVETGDECDVCTAEVIDMMTHHPDKGPWYVSEDGDHIMSGDFRHDVILVVTGDFFDDDVRKQYSDHLCDILNKAITPPAPSMFDPRDTKQLREWYSHPKYENEEGQGYYIMVSIRLKAVICASGNALLDLHQRDPAQWLTGPLWVPMSNEDYIRIWDREHYLIDRF